MQNLVVGLGRVSTKWSGRGLLARLDNREFFWPVRQPVRQLAHLCKITKTRYGYIQTNEELVALEFRLTLLSQGAGRIDVKCADYAHGSRSFALPTIRSFAIQTPPEQIHTSNGAYSRPVHMRYYQH